MSDRQFPDEYYDEQGVYIPRLYGKPWYEWAAELNLYSIKEIDKYFLTGDGFCKSKKYIKFQEELKEWVRPIAAAINTASEWQEGLFDIDLVDEPIEILQETIFVQPINYLQY